MVYRVRLDNAIARAGLLTGLLAAALGLAWLSSRHFIVRTLADQRLSYSNEILLPAATRLPASPRLQKRLVESWLTAGEPDYVRAGQHAAQAVRLTPRSGRLWHLLAQAQEGQGLTAEAEQSLWQAAALAPADSQVNWALANLLVRAGKVDESAQYFRRAVALNASLYPLAFDTLWQAGGRKPELLQAICSAQPAAQLSLAQYLVEQKLYRECALIFQSPEAQAWAAWPQTNDVLNQLLAAQQPLIARSIWLRMQPAASAEAGAASGALWDGGFETEPLAALPHFNWALRDSTFARAGYDDSVRRSGQHSLKLLFTGRDTTVLGGDVQQRLALEPGRRYRFEAYVKSEALVTSEGPRLVIAQDGKPLAQSPPLPSGTWDWQLFAFEFVAPATGAPVVFDILRTLKYAYDEPTKGALWFDELKLTVMEN